jgi:hypothetical protein
MRNRLKIDLIYTQVILLWFCTGYYAKYHLQVSFLLYKRGDADQCGGFWEGATAYHIKRFLGPPQSDAAGMHRLMPTNNDPYPVEPDVVYRTWIYRDFYDGTLYITLYSKNGREFRIRGTSWYANNENVCF